MLADTSEQWSICVYLCLLSMHDEYSVEFMFGCLALARNSPASQTTKLYTQYILYNYIILTDKHMVICVRLCWHALLAAEIVTGCMQYSL